MALSPFCLPNGEPNPKAVVEQAAFCAAIYKADTVRTAQILGLTGGGSILYGNHDDTTWPPSYAVGKQGSRYNIVFAGTTNAKQVLSHIGGAIGSHYTEYYTDVDEIRLDETVHPVWFIAWSRMRDDVLLFLDGMTADETVSVTGHSYGGAIAFLCALHLARILGGHRVEVMTFAAPFVVSKNYSGALPFSMVRVVHEGDAVPSLGPQTPWYLQPVHFAVKVGAKTQVGYGHFGKRLTINTNGTGSTDEKQEPLWFTQPINVLDTAIAENHYMTSYARDVKKWFNKSGIQQPTSLIANIGEEIARGLPLPSDQDEILLSTYLSLAEVDTLYRGTNKGVPVLAGDLSGSMFSIQIGILKNRVTVDTVTVVEDHPIQSSTMAFQSEVNVSASGFWKLCMVINNSKHGTTSSVVWKGEPEMAKAIQKGALLCNQRSTLLGNINQGTVRVKSKASPQIEFLRISDALNPRIAETIDIDPGTGFNYATTGDGFPSDVFSTALSLRLRGVNESDNATTSVSNHQIIGQPDDCVRLGEYVPTAVVNGRGDTIGALLAAYQLYLTDPANHYGYMGQSVAEGKKIATLVTYNNLGRYEFTVAGHGFEDGDKVRITSSNAKGFNGTHKVIVVSSDKFYLAENLVSGLPLPTLAKVQLIQDADGERKEQFYAFKRPAEGFSVAARVKVSKKNLTREILGVSFRRRS